MFTHSQLTPDWLTLSHVDCFSQCQLVGLEVIQACLHPIDPRTSLPFIQWEEVKHCYGSG